VTIWHFITPALIWLTALTYGRYMLFGAPEKLWKGMQPFRTEPLPYDSQRSQHRATIVMARLQGALLFLIAIFATVMSLLVAAGIVPAARS
jgi:hypothetical protein